MFSLKLLISVLDRWHVFGALQERGEKWNKPRRIQSAVPNLGINSCHCVGRCCVPSTPVPDANVVPIGTGVGIGASGEQLVIRPRYVRGRIIREPDLTE